MTLRTKDIVSFSMLAAIVLFALVGPLITPDPRVQDLNHVLSLPSLAHPLGTDHLGRDMAGRLSHAARLSLSFAAISVLTAAAFGTLLGVTAAWRRGWMERVLSTLADGVLAIPGLLLVALITGIAPGRYLSFYIGISLALWVEYFRVVRSTSRVILQGSPCEASKLLGFGPVYIVRRHLLPELMPVLLALMSFGTATSILSLAAFGIVGVGLQPPTPEMGIMTIELLPYYREAPWLLLQPVVLLMLTVTSFSLLAAKERPL
jgi:peptide/nickel transport system permease protein